MLRQQKAESADTVFGLAGPVLPTRLNKPLSLVGCWEGTTRLKTVARGDLDGILENTVCLKPSISPG